MRPDGFRSASRARHRTRERRRRSGCWCCTASLGRAGIGDRWRSGSRPSDRAWVSSSSICACTGNRKTRRLRTRSAAAAEDLVRLEAVLAGPVRGVIGHSFGGKVALEFVALRRADLKLAVLVDANPGVRDVDRLDASARRRDARLAAAAALVARSVLRPRRRARHRSTTRPNGWR